VGRSTVLGNRSTSWIHLSLDDRYRNSSKPPVPFNGVHTFEGQSFNPPANEATDRNIYNGRVINSTNGDTSTQPCPTITQWKGEYWNNQGLSGNPALCRNDATVNFDWGVGSPDGRVPSDHFSARWTRTLDFGGGRYRFHVRGDDGVRLWLDDNLIIDAWRGQGPTEYMAERDLNDANHSLRVEYYENGGGAVAQFRWEQSGGGTPIPDHAMQLYADWHFTPDNYCYSDVAGSFNVCSDLNDKVSSVLLAVGWSVRVYKDANISGTSRCISTSDDDFSNDTFEDGSPLNDQMSSLTLYQQPNCSGAAVRSPLSSR
jgi:hypothetical protein